MGKQECAGNFRQVWRLMLLSLAVTWLAIGNACALAGSPTASEGSAEEQSLSSTPKDAGPYDDSPVLEETHDYYDKARLMAIRGKWEEAILLYDQAIALDPSYMVAYEGRALSYHALGRHMEAIRDYDRAIAIRGASRLYVARGNVYLELGKYPRADKDYHLAQSLGLFSSAVYMGVGDAHRSVGELEEAARNYSDAISLDPDIWRAYYFRGVCYFRLRQLQRALADFERVITLQPHNAGSYFARGSIWWLGGQCINALEDFELFLALTDDGEALRRAQMYIADIKSMAQCEPPMNIPLFV